MKKILALGVLVVWTASPVLAQQISLEPLRLKETVSAKQDASDGPWQVHITDDLMRTPEARVAMAEVEASKAAGVVPEARTATYSVGEIATFKVRNIAESSDGPLKQDDIDFELRVEASQFNIWVEVSELDNGHVTQDLLNALFEALGQVTPSASFNPDAGIIENDEAVFGLPPNIDGDGKTDVLIVDVRDGFDPDTHPFFVGGFFDPVDQGVQGNGKDIVYLDTHPTLTRHANPEDAIEEVGLTVAHEYQHLIHWEYDRTEDSFVNEGLSEWAEVLNGYPGRRTTYLTDPLRYNVRLLSFSDEEDDDDRQRGALFTNYFADRLGIEAAGAITREAADGATGYSNVLTTVNAGVTLGELLLDFHIANLLNDTTLDPNYGYTTAIRSNLRSTPRVTYNGLTETPPQSSAPVAVNAGGVEYIEWRNVENMKLSFENQQDTAPVEARALLFRGGLFETRAVDVNSTGSEDLFELFSGDYDRIAVVFAHTNPTAARAEFSYTTTWDSGASYDTQEVAYDDGQNITIDGAISVLPTESEPANRFDVPPGAILASVAVAPYYDNQFNGSTVPSNAPSDFEVVIWDDEVIERAGGSVHVPGDTELFKTVVSDDRRNLQGGNLVFKEVDLSGFQAEIPPLPDVIHVSIRNAGMDDNLLYIGLTAYPGNTDEASSVSSLQHPNLQGWVPFFAIVNANTNEPLFHNQVVPIRATFLVPTTPVANEDEVELPDRVVLHANYPNPFNPTTTLAYDLPRAAYVRLAVYDLLGREVAVLVDGQQAAGAHTLALDATRWSSGLYFYTLEAAGQKQTRRMVLVK